MAFWLFQSGPTVSAFGALIAEPDRPGRLPQRLAQLHLAGSDPPRRPGPVLPLEHRPDRRRLGRGDRGGALGPDGLRPQIGAPRPAISGSARPTWISVCNRALRPIDPPLGLPALRTVPALATMERSRKGTRLSVQPVMPEQWATILELAEQPATTPETG